MNKESPGIKRNNKKDDISNIEMSLGVSKKSDITEYQFDNIQSNFNNFQKLTKN